MKIHELELALKNDLKPIYLIKGDDVFLRAKVVESIITETSLKLPEFNLSEFNEDNFNILNIFNSVNQMPFASDKKIIVCEARTITADFKARLQEYAEHPNTSAVLIIIELAAGVCSTIEKLCETIDFSNMFESEVRSEILAYIKLKNIDITPDALNDLLARTSFSLSKCVVELEKLQVFCQGQIDLPSVQSLVSKTLEYNIFEFTNALANKNKQLALELLSEMLKYGNSNIISLVSSNFRRIFFASISDQPNAELAKTFGVKEFAITKAKANAKNFTPKKLKEILEMLEEVEYLSKSGGMTAENSAYYLTFKILES